MMPQLRQDILTAIAAHWQEHGYGPSVRDLQIATGGHSTSVIAYNLDALVSKGLIIRDPGIARSIRLTEESKAIATA